jgi:hypothetical protein
MNQLIASIPGLNKVPLFIFLILAMVCCIIAISLMIIGTKLRMKGLKARQVEMEESETDEFVIQTFKANDNKQLKTASRVLKIAIFGYILSLLCICLFCSYSILAKSYGAFDNFIKQETPKSVIEHTTKGFQDQSELVPDDLTGKIIIYVKYGCPDCEGIHDDLLSYLERSSLKNKEDYYFVSTRSKKGKELLAKYEVFDVPAAVYIRKNVSTSTDVSYITQTLYEKENEDDTATFVANNFDKLLSFKDSDE